VSSSRFDLPRGGAAGALAEAVARAEAAAVALGGAATIALDVLGADGAAEPAGRMSPSSWPREAVEAGGAADAAPAAEPAALTDPRPT
jgi:hypothetical protein